MTLMLCIGGCATGNKQAASPASADHVDPGDQVRAAEPEPPANAYYYFIRARLALKAARKEKAAGFMEKAVKASPGDLFLKRDLARIYLELDRKEDALALVEAVVEQAPDNVEALIVAGSIRQSMGKNDAAQQAYEKVLQKDPGREDIYPVLARLYLHDEAYENAADLLEPFLERFPQNYTGFFYLAKAYTQMGEIEKAIDAYKKSLEIKPELVEPRVGLIEIYNTRGQQDQSMTQYEKLLSRHPGNVAAAIELGLLYETRGKKKKAGELWSDLADRVSSDSAVVRNVIRQLLSRERYPDAMTVLSGMLEYAPDDPALHYLAGATRYMMEQFEPALAHFHSVGPDAAFYPDAMIHRALIYNKQGKPGQAVSVLEIAMDNVESTARLDLIPYLSAFYQEQGLYEQAAELLKEGLSMEPENVELHYELGVLYDRKGDRDAAIEKMKQVIRMDSENADALNYLGYTYADQGVKLDKAESLIRQALDLDPGSGYILDSMGWVYYRKGDYEAARKYLERAVDRVADDPVIFEHLADVYIKLNQREKALQYYRKARETAGRKKDKEALADKIEALEKQGVQP
ncbi:MAG: tetratricopeptide repeat protein [Desulfobacterales bacterium]|nr:tetratricopeptide repeat protein [Desulfobacterales bacterium]MBS3754155.1 tetratricopeptide repeat protein [Desulfobacterales bacterium]